MQKLTPQQIAANLLVILSQGQKMATEVIADKACCPPEEYVKASIESYPGKEAFDASFDQEIAKGRDFMKDLLETDPEGFQLIDLALEAAHHVNKTAGEQTGYAGSAVVHNLLVLARLGLLQAQSSAVATILETRSQETVPPDESNEA